MKNEQKAELAYNVKTLKANGFEKNKAIKTLQNSFPEVSKSTIQKYWKIFSQEKQETAKD